MVSIKQIVFFVFVVCCFSSCKEKTEPDPFVSNGNINEISIVINDTLWNSEVGDNIRSRLAAPIDGLTQDEPIFTLNQYHEDTFNAALKKGRNIIIVKTDDNHNFHFKKNSYCSPQNVFTITGRNSEQLVQLIDMHVDEIIKTIKQTEIAENQERNIKTGLLDSLKFAKKFGISINVPTTYTYAIEQNNFIWLKKDVHSGNTNILVYTVPYDAIEKNKTIVNNIIAMRDSIGTKYIHGQENNTFMVTEEAYSPSIFMTSFKERPAFETRGNWEMENGSMNGPFLNYAIRDDNNQRYLIIEGFIYSPSSPKRDLIIELESIIKSANI